MKNFIKTDNQGNIIEQGSTNLLELDNNCYFVDRLPESDFYQYIGGNLVLNIDKVKADKILEIKECRSNCWQKFDGMYLGCERDKNDVMVADCELLRQSLKDAPEKALELLESCTTIDEIENINFKSCLDIPDSLKDICNLV